MHFAHTAVKQLQRQHIEPQFSFEVPPASTTLLLPSPPWLPCRATQTLFVPRGGSARLNWTHNLTVTARSDLRNIPGSSFEGAKERTRTSV